MSRRFECDYCGEIGMGFEVDMPSDWIRVGHAPLFSPWHNHYMPSSIHGDYCSIECLANKVREAIMERDELIERLGMPR